MKRLYKGEKTGLKLELNTIKILLIALFLSNNLFPQIPINGFDKYDVFDVEKGLSRMLSFNFDGDPYADLLLFKPTGNKLLLLKRQKNGTFGDSIVYKLPLNIFKIVPLFDKTSKQKEFIFIDRKAMLAGIYSLQKKGKPKLLFYTKFHSYPNNISTSVLNDNGINKILLSGSAFNGLSILFKSKDKLISRKIVKNKSYSNAIFIDLTNDGYPDIAAFNLLTDSLEFFYNDGSYNFRKARTIYIGSTISSLRSVDLNLDNYQDLMYVKGDSISIRYGDFASSYDTTTTISTLYHPDKIITGDFNSDGKIDVAYINYKNSILSLIFAKGSHTFYPEIIYTRQEGIKDLIPYYSKFVDGIAVLSNNGKLFTVTKTISLSDNIKITAGPEPGALNYFDDNNNGIIDLCFIDSFNPSFNCVVRDSRGIPKFYYSYNLFKDHSKIIVDNIAPNVKSFYCYSPGKKLIEALKINFVNGKVEKNQLYSPGQIQGLKIAHNKNQKLNLYVAYKNKDKSGLIVFDDYNGHYSIKDNFNISKKALGISIILGNTPGLSYWNIKGDTLLLNQAVIDLGISKIKAKLPIKSPDSLRIVSYTGNLLNNGSNSTISFIKTIKNNYVVFSSDKLTYELKGKMLPHNLVISRNSRFFFGRKNLNGNKKLFVHIPESGTINMIDILQGGKKIEVSNLTKVKDVYSYFIKNMGAENYHLVYSDSSEGCIIIKQLQ